MAGTNPDYPYCPVCGDVGHTGCADAMISEVYDLRARLAEAEAAETRLAEVEAKLNEMEAATGGTETIDRIRAALRGEEA